MGFSVTKLDLHDSILIMVSLLLAVAVFRLARIGRLSFRYSIGWFSLSALGIFSSLFVPFVQPIADYFLVSPISIVAMFAVLMLLSICVQLSISISGLQSQNRIIVEELALLRLEHEDRTNQGD